MTDPWQQGYDAFENGLPRGVNPYTCDWQDEWNLGYWAACDDETYYREFLAEEEANGQTNNL